MPDVPPPEQCESDEDMYRRLIRDSSGSAEVVERYKEMLVVSLTPFWYFSICDFDNL
jgi:acyl-CoA thioesterase